MCGRYTDTKRDKEFLVRMGVAAANATQLEFTPRYNIAPTQEAKIIALGEDGVELRDARWGLIPFWAKDEKIGSSLINARFETVATKPAFRNAYKKQRCLVLADGFYEWRKAAGAKEPIYFRMKEGRQFVFGGLWERWREGERQVDSFCIITVPPNELCSKTHDRMPLIVPENVSAPWLDPKAKQDDVSALLKPYRVDEMEAFAVSKLVNNPRNETARCAEPMATGTLEMELTRAVGLDGAPDRS